MKYWGVVVALLYVVIFVVVVMPLMVFLLPNAQAGMSWWQDISDRIGSIFSPLRDSWGIIAYLVALFLAQILLLSIPVSIAEKRPVVKKSILPVVVTTASMMGLLGAGAILALNENITKGNYDTVSFLIIVGVFLAVWGLWARVFFHLSKKMEPRDFIERQCKYLFRGSVLELLIAVPAHILARQRTDCCAGLQTFVGIAFGISVMLFSFGPGIFFLFAERLQHLRKKAG